MRTNPLIYPSDHYLIMQLVILAAGLGSRFKGNKQTTPIDDDGNFIIDYSVFDAVSAGFDSVVFIIRKENEEIFRNTIGNRIGSNIRVEYVFQEPDSVPDDRIPEDRTKPLGTAHAILCCKDTVKEPFMIINADDFYGIGSYRKAKEFIDTECDDTVYGCVCYEASRTMTESGSVKRGICTVEDGNVILITESNIERNDSGSIEARPLNGSEGFVTPDDTPVSMNMFIVPPSVFPILEKGFDDFLSGWKDPMKDEYLLPDVISDTVNRGKATLRCIRSDETWFGVTYPDDKEKVVNALRDKVIRGEYPKGLWNNTIQ